MVCPYLLYPGIEELVLLQDEFVVLHNRFLLLRDLVDGVKEGSLQQNPDHCFDSAEEFAYEFV